MDGESYPIKSYNQICDQSSATLLHRPEPIRKLLLRVVPNHSEGAGSRSRSANGEGTDCCEKMATVEEFGELAELK